MCSQAVYICLAVPYAVQCCVICILLKFYSINSKPDLKPLCEGLLGSFEKLVRIQLAFNTLVADYFPGCFLTPSTTIGDSSS